MKLGEKKFYIYTYDVMCQDISNNNSWSRINAYMFLSVLSLIYRVEIVLVSVVVEKKSNRIIYGKEPSIINAYQECTSKPEMRTIYLACIDNFHYVPLAKGDHGPRKIYYKTARAEFKKWALLMEAQMNSNPIPLSSHHPTPMIGTNSVLHQNQNPFEGFVDCNQINNN